MRTLPLKDFPVLLAEELLRRHGNNLSGLCVVFPSRRAGIFFLNALTEVIDRPIFAPQITTIEEFASTVSGLIAADNLTLTTLLYDEMRRYYKEIGIRFEEYTPEIRIEQCQKLLADFNDADNYLVSTEKLFQNIRNLEELSSFDYLTDEQRKLILNFWNVALPQKRESYRSETNSEASDGAIQERFISFSGEIRHLYPRYIERLRREGYGYEGIIYKEAGNISPKELAELLLKKYPQRKYFAFAGLYALTPAERRIIDNLRKTISPDNLSFFWEGLAEDPRYPIFENRFLDAFKGNISENQSRFGGITLTPRTGETPPQVDVLEVSSVVAGRKIAPMVLKKILEKDPKAVEELRTALILPDETGLPPLLSTLGATLSVPLNVTMGYPLAQTNVALWFRQYIDFMAGRREQENGSFFSSEKLDQLIRHPLSGLLLNTNEIDRLKQLKLSSLPYFSLEELAEDAEASSAFFQALLSPPQSVDAMLQQLRDVAQLFSSKIREKIEEKSPEKEGNEENRPRLIDLEYLKRYEETILSLMNVLPIIQGGLDISTAAKILISLIDAVKVPFEGEPLEGLQVMGVLESRLLLFDYIVIPDANEKQLPKSYSQEGSFIPFTLRLGYGLPIYKSREAIEAYYLYRLLLGCKRIVFITGGTKDEENSRYILQLKYLSRLSVNFPSIKMPEATYTPKELQMDKTPEVMRLLGRYLAGAPESKAFSASSLNTYSRCPLSFYFRYVRGIEEDIRPDALISPIDFGTLVHESMEELYKDYRGKVISRGDWENITERVPRVVEEKYLEIVFKGRKNKPALEGIHKIYADQAIAYIRTVLRHDARYPQLRYLDSEKKVVFDYPFSRGRVARIKGFIDRIDTLHYNFHDILRIIDYKTGSDSTTFSNWLEIFPTQAEQSEKAIDYKSAVAQLLLYCDYWTRQHENEKRKIAPALYKLIEMNAEEEAYDPSIIFKPKGRGGKSTPIENFLEGDIREDFEIRLSALLEEIFDSSIPFKATIDKHRCEYCAFREVCGK